MRTTRNEDTNVSSDHPRITRERKTVEAMIGIYCQDRHGTGNGLCPECEVLRDYARQRLQKCPFQEGKTTCAKCPVHCYKPDMREQDPGRDALRRSPDAVPAPHHDPAAHGRWPAAKSRSGSTQAETGRTKGAKKQGRSTAWPDPV